MTILPVMIYYEWQINYVIRCPNEQPSGHSRTSHSRIEDWVFFCTCMIHTPRRSPNEEPVCRLHGVCRMTRVWFSLWHSWIVHHQMHVMTPCNDIKGRFNLKVVIIASHSTLNILLNTRSYVFSKWPVSSQSLPRCRTWRFVCHWERR